MILINMGDNWLHQYGDEQQAKTLYKQGLHLWQDMQRVDNGLGIVRGLDWPRWLRPRGKQSEQGGCSGLLIACYPPPASPEMT
jgi:hypothetical protein